MATLGQFPVSGAAEALSTVRIYVDEALAATTRAGEDGAFTANFSATPGSHSLYATSINGAGTSANSTVVHFSVVIQTAP